MMLGEIVDWKKWFWERNEAGWDRALRIIGGLVLLYIFLQGYLSGLVNCVVLFFSVVGIVTGLIGHCLIYVILGIRTNK